MSVFLRQSTAVDVALGPFLDSTDGVTAETGLTISQADVRLKKNAGAWAQVNDSTAATHEENGWYEKELDATDTNTVGRLLIAVHESGALPVWHEFWVLEEAIYDALFAASATGALPVSAGGIAAASFAAGAIDAAAIAANAIGASEVADDAIDAGAVAADAIGAAEIAANAIGASEVADDAIDAGAIAANAIGAAELADDAIDAGAIAADAIGASEIAANAIGASELADDAIDAGAIAASAIGASEIATDAIGAAEIADDAIDAGAIAASAIGASELAADAITSSELAASAVTEIADAVEGGGGGAAGSGALTRTVRMLVGASPLQSVAVWVSTDEEGSNVVAGTLITDSFGIVTFLLDAGTYYVWARKDGYNPVVAEEIEVTA